MDIDQFIHIYGKHNVKVLDTGFISLRLGDTIQAGDQAYTWLSVDCNELGWIPVPKGWWNTKCTPDMVEIRRKDVTAAYARTNPIPIKWPESADFHMCPSCGNIFPKSQIKCGECGHTM